MTKKFYDVTVEYTGTKTFRVYMEDGEDAATLGYIAENYYRMEQNHNPNDEREEMIVTAVIYGEQE
jgi:hypothetical protein